MYTKTDTTEASKVKYDLTFPQYDDLVEMIQITGKLDEARTTALRKALEPFTESLKPLESVINQHTKQNATQGNKDSVRKAIAKATKAGVKGKALLKHKGVAEAIAEHQKLCRKYTLAEARGSGMGKVKAGKLGSALRDKVGEEKFREIMAEHGLSEEDLAAK